MINKLDFLSVNMVNYICHESTFWATPFWLVSYSSIHLMQVLGRIYLVQLGWVSI